MCSSSSNTVSQLACLSVAMFINICLDDLLARMGCLDLWMMFSRMGCHLVTQFPRIRKLDRGQLSNSPRLPDIKEGEVYDYVVLYPSNHMWCYNIAPHNYSSYVPPIIRWLVNMNGWEERVTITLDAQYHNMQAHPMQPLNVVNFLNWRPSLL